jgi:hypothetical protein
MPAQWPKFIKNVSGRMTGQGYDSVEEWALFLADEYFNVVKTAQAPYGETHVSGQKSVLDAGFVAAFDKIFNEERVSFEDKFELPRFADFNEPTIVPNYTDNTFCEIENCINQNRDLEVSFIDYRKSNKPEKTHTYDKFQFFSLFPSICPDDLVEVDFTGGINIEELISDQLEKDQSLIDAGISDLFATLTIYGFNELGNYKFLYSINGEDQPIERAVDGSFSTRIPAAAGEYKYIFKEVYDEDLNLIKVINKEASVTISEKGDPVIVNILEDESDQQEPTPKILDILNTDSLDLNNKEVKDYLLDSLTERVLLQNDETEEFYKWVKRFSSASLYNYPRWVRSILKDLEKRIMDLADIVREKIIEEAKQTKNNRSLLSNYKNKIINRFDIKEIIENSKINQYTWQANKKLDIDLPKWLDTKAILAFTYDEYWEQPNLMGNSSMVESIRIQGKEAKYKQEEDKWFDRLTACVSNKDVDKTQSDLLGDGYDDLAESIINYWKSCTVQPLAATPPVPPCNVPAPLGGKYVPIYYGNQAGLANKLRRAFNTGKKFKLKGMHRPPSVAVATAVAAACSMHLLELKFIYLGGIATPTSPIPMIGFVPVVF